MIPFRPVVSFVPGFHELKTVTDPNEQFDEKKCSKCHKFKSVDKFDKFLNGTVKKTCNSCSGRLPLKSIVVSPAVKLKPDSNLKTCSCCRARKAKNEENFDSKSDGSFNKDCKTCLYEKRKKRNEIVHGIPLKDFLLKIEKQEQSAPGTKIQIKTSFYFSFQKEKGYMVPAESSESAVLVDDSRYDTGDNSALSYEERDLNEFFENHDHEVKKSPKSEIKSIPTKSSQNIFKILKSSVAILLESCCPYSFSLTSSSKRKNKADSFTYTLYFKCYEDQRSRNIERRRGCATRESNRTIDCGSNVALLYNRKNGFTSLTYKHSNHHTEKGRFFLLPKESEFVDTLRNNAGAGPTDVFRELKIQFPDSLVTLNAVRYYFKRNNRKQS